MPGGERKLSGEGVCIFIIMWGKDTTHEIFLETKQLLGDVQDATATFLVVVIVVKISVVIQTSSLPGRSG